MNSVHTLGINAVFHDSAAALVRDGEIVAAAEEERFSRIKHAKRPVPFSAWELPYNAIDYCLREAGIDLRDVDRVAYSFDPSLLPFVRSLHGDGESIALPLEPSAHPAPAGADSPWEPLMMSYVVNAPRQLVDGVPLRLARRFHGARAGETFEWRFVPHHLAHAASAPPRRTSGATGIRSSSWGRWPCPTRSGCSTSASPAISASCIRPTSTR
jgi:carbamoyltransferase